MAKNTVLILHGWSDTAESFQHLKQILHANGYPTASVYLGSYESMEDHVTFDNLAAGFQARITELQSQGALTLAPYSLDIIAHSTGGPVLRHWLIHYLQNVCQGDCARCPVHRIILLAPANFGSRLAAQGQSALAMLFKGGIRHGFQTGQHILQGLELGSPFLWQLAHNDLFGKAPIYPCEKNQGPYVFVFSGTRTYDELRGFVAPGATEDGSDGTVRAASASMNSIKLTVDFSARDHNKRLVVQRQCNEPMAFKLIDGVNHSEIVPKKGTASAQPVIDLILRCLTVGSDSEYAEIREAFWQENEQFYQQQQTLPPGNRVARYQQFIIRVCDSMGVEVEDYRLAFHVIDQQQLQSTWHDSKPGPELLKYQQYTTQIQEKMIAHMQAHTVRPSYRTIFMNLDERERLEEKLKGEPEHPFIALNLDAFSPTPGVSYNTDELQYLPLNQPFTDPEGREATFFYANTSTLVEIVLNPVTAPTVFNFTNDPVQS
jgi:pimeloyl-ACP methyl ester carboxylesterase